MSSEREIRMNFTEAKRQAQQLETIAEKMRRIATQDMENSMQTLSRSWQGSSASAFIQKETLLKKKVSDSATELQNIARTIRSVAQRVYEAEMAAWRIANTRSSGGGGGGGAW